MFPKINLYGFIIDRFSPAHSFVQSDLVNLIGLVVELITHYITANLFPEDNTVSSVIQFSLHF